MSDLDERFSTDSEGLFLLPATEPDPTRIGRFLGKKLSPQTAQGDQITKLRNTYDTKYDKANGTGSENLLHDMMVN